MEIKYFDHPHHLLSLSKTKYDLIDCPICLEKLGSIGTQNYNCSTAGCKYGVHESCAKLPREVQSPYHPHPLTLRRPLILGRLDFYSSRCNGCRKYDKGFVYGCDDCDFKLGLECAFMGPVKVIEGEGEGGCQGQLRKHPNHQQHPLLLFEKVPNKHYKCPVCLKYCSDPDPTYGCWECCLYLHDGLCFETKLPPQIQHFYHPHPLTLSTTPRNVKCRACYEWSWNIIWSYSCKQCKDFGMDIPCALLVLAASTTTKSESQIQHFLHGHTLSLNENKLDDQKVADCCVCGKGCTGPTIYVCGRDGNCKNIYFHKSCLEFPQQICHPFHPYHPLTLTLVEQNFYHLKICNACRKSIHTFILHGHCSFAYICEGHNCNFLLHAECSTVMMPVITYEGHAHLLQFRDHNIENNKLNCSACKSNICESCAFTCLDCDLNLHLLCGPLPHSIKHKDHNVHPLLLTNSPVQEELEDETGEFYCHACEEERDPQLPVYYCAECQFVAEIKCVFSELILLLKGEHGDVDLRTTSGQFGKLIFKNIAKEMAQEKEEQIKTPLTLFDILKSWSIDEIEQLNSVLRAGERTLVIAKEDGYDEDSAGETLLFSDKTYTQFMKLLDRGTKIPTPFNNVGEVPKVSPELAPKEEVVSVGDYMVTLKLVPILKHLLSKHKDISATSILRPRVKMYLLNMLCECICSMINTKVVNITENLLLNWWTCLKILQFAEFRIQFAFDHLKRVAHAYLGLHVRKEVDITLDKIDTEIQALEDKRKHVIAAKSTKSNLFKECLREASILKYGNAGTFFLYR